MATETATSARIKAGATALAELGGHEELVAGLFIVGDVDGVDSLPAAMGEPPSYRPRIKLSEREAALERFLEHFGAGNASHLAARIHAAIDLYYAAGWQRDRHAGKRPPGVNGLAYDFLKASPQMSISWLRHHPLVVGKSGARACHETRPISRHGTRIPPPTVDQQRHR
jgi:hypothetical protein